MFWPITDRFVRPGAINEHRFIVAICFFWFVGFSASIQAQATLNCSASYQISHSFANGAQWDMCWERQNREGIIYSDIYYTAPGGSARQILNSVAIAQIHVPYDDDGARYHDVSDYGLGTSQYLNNLQAADCPDGVRVQENGKNVICRSVYTDETSSLTNNATTPSEILSVFSVSHVGAYNYIPEYRFHDTGVIEPVMGATGTLQRYGSNTAEGWTVRTGSNPVGISHLHNYYWRLDFDLGASGTDDVFEEIEFVAESGSNTSFAKSVTDFTTEVARSINADTRRFWRVRDNTDNNADGLPVSYDILPLDTGHRDIGPADEPWTENDIYVTQHRACERFASRNPSDPGGCLANEHVSDFVNGESLVNEDLVVWFGITFHHIPRDEDEPRMHAHWNHFRLIPRDWTAESVNSQVNFPPAIIDISDQNNLLGETINLQIIADDPSNQIITYTQSGLPAGLTLDANSGLISGTVTAAEGTYPVSITVTNSGNASNTIELNWSVDTDTDNDSLPNGIDNCPSIPNINQLDTDEDGDGNACDETPLGACASFASADVPQAISTSGTPTVLSSLSVTLNGSLSSVAIIDLVGSHTYMSDLIFTLTNPSNTSVTIIESSCGGNDNFDLTLDDGANSSYPCPPIGGGTYLPSNSLAPFVGQSAGGQWTLTIADTFNDDGGSLDSWGLQICTGDTTSSNDQFWSEGFEGANNWTPNPLGTDSATSGQWSAGDPIQTQISQGIIQPADSSEGTQALITNPAGGSVGANDIDGGAVTAKSPLISLPSATNIALSFDFFFAHDANATSADYFRLKLVDTFNTTLLVIAEELGTSAVREGQWITVNNINLNAYQGQDVALIVEAADDGTSNIVEAGLDNIKILTTQLDADSDGIVDSLDKCPNVANPNQLNADNDSFGDACDAFPNDPDNDIDGDTISGHIDNCPAVANGPNDASNQLDNDGDDTGDACDIDADGDGIDGNGSGGPGTDINDLDNTIATDADSDGVDDAGGGTLNGPDNCLGVPNADQANTDGDGLGNACDSFPNDPDNDLDGDTISGHIDNCFAVANGPNDASNQLNFDNDAFGDACDTDADGDGFDGDGAGGPSANDVDDLNAGLAVDPDGDLVDSSNVLAVIQDNCPAEANADQINNDGDAQGDACDTDADGDGFDGDGAGGPSANDVDDLNAGLAVDPDGDLVDSSSVLAVIQDNCPAEANAEQTNTDGDAQGDACDPFPNDPDNDLDDDTVSGHIDNCPAVANGPNDASNQLNLDADTFGDACDTDADGDGFDGDGAGGPSANDVDDLNAGLAVDPDGDLVDSSSVLAVAQDNCPAEDNADQTNTDGDAQGDACDPFPNDPDNDLDDDTVSGHIDNCPSVANGPNDASNQLDDDNDSVGNVCDAFPNDPDNDIDGDTVSGEIDNCPTEPNTDQLNTDGDSEGNACDADDDNDNLTDIEEQQYGTDPLLIDTDGDGITDAEEIAVGRNPNQFDAFIPLPLWAFGLLSLIMFGIYSYRSKPFKK